MARYYDQDASLAAGTMVGVRGKDRLIFFVAITKRVAVSNVLHTSATVSFLNHTPC